MLLDLQHLEQECQQYREFVEGRGEEGCGGFLEQVQQSARDCQNQINEFGRFWTTNIRGDDDDKNATIN